MAAIPGPFSGIAMAAESSPTIGSTKEGSSSMAETPAAPDLRSVAALRHAASQADDYAEQQRLVAAAEIAQQQVIVTAAEDRALDFLGQNTSPMVPGRVHELHTAATDWIGGVDTSPGTQQASHHATARGTIWYQNLPGEVKADSVEFGEQARYYAARISGSFGDSAEIAEESFLTHVATLRHRDQRAGMFAVASPMPSQPGDPKDTFTTGGGQDWLPEEATSSNRAPVMRELATESPSADVVPENDPGLGDADPDPAVAAQERTAARHLARGPEDLEAWPRCAKCHNPVAPIEMAHTSSNDVVHGSCVGITGSITEGHSSMQQAACPTCGTHVAARQAPSPSIRDIVFGGTQRVANSGLPQIEQIVDPSDTQPQTTPLPPEVAFPWTMAPGQVENTIGEAEQQIAEREQRKGAALRAQANAAANEAYGMAYREAQRLGLHHQAQHYGNAAAREAIRLVMQAGQDDSGWLGDMGQGGVAPGQQDGGNAPSSNLGEPDPVYGYGGGNGNQPLRPYGEDEADDATNNPGMNWQPGQPLQYDMGGRGNSTETPPGGGAVPKQSSLAEIEAGDAMLQKAGNFMRQRRAYLRQQVEAATS